MAEAAAELVISVPELTLSDDGKTASFKVTSEFRSGADSKVHSVSRTYGQFVALQGKIAEANKNKLVPVLPEPPHPTHKDDADHIEKRRRQFDRFLSRLANRSEFASNGDLKAFLTATAFGDEKKSSGGAAVVSNLMTALKSDVGFKSFKPTLEIDHEDEADVEKKKAIVNQSEKDHKAVLDAAANVARTRGALGKQIAASCQALSDIDFGKTLFSPVSKQGIDFGTDLSNLHNEQAKEEIFHFGDVFLEKKNFANAFRTLINNRTDLLASIEAAIKYQQKTAAAIESAKKKHGETGAETNRAIDEDDKAKANIKQLKEDYAAFKISMKAEYAAYAEEKLVDYQMAIDHFVRTQINSEQEKLTLLESFHRKLVAAA